MGKITFLQAYEDDHEVTCNSCSWKGKVKELLAQVGYDEYSEVIRVDACPKCFSTELHFA